MRTITYNGDSAKVVIGNVGVFERGVPVEFPDELEADADGLTDSELLEHGLNFDPDVWTVDPPFPRTKPHVEADPAGDDTKPARPRAKAKKETTNG